MVLDTGDLASSSLAIDPSLSIAWFGGTAGDVVCGGMRWYKGPLRWYAVGGFNWGVVPSELGECSGYEVLGVCRIQSDLHLL